MSKPLARAVSIVLAATLAAGGALVGAVPAQALPLAYVVDSAGDEAPGFVCDSSTAPTSPLTLRRALCLVDRSGPVSATVSIQAATVQVAAALGPIPVGAYAGDNLTVNSFGAPSTITSLGGGQLFTLDPQQLGGISVAFDALTFSDAVDNTVGGAAISAGSGLASSVDRLSITNSTFSNNAANTIGSATNLPGGAIQFLGGSLTVSNTTFTGNSSGSSAGGAIAYQATGAGTGEGLSVTGSRFSGNTMVNSWPPPSEVIVDGAPNEFTVRLSPA